MTFTVNATALAGLQQKLEAFAAKVKDEVAMTGTAAMAEVIYEEARARVPVSSGPHVFYGKNSKNGTKYYFNSGNLKAAIYRAYSPEKSKDTLKLYRVSWNHTKAPYGAIVEFGSSRAAAHPFLRPAASKIEASIEAGKARMAARIERIKGGA